MRIRAPQPRRVDCEHQAAAARAAKRGVPKAERTPEEAAAAAAFDEVTEAASALMDAGELDAYSATREELERAAAAFPAPDDDEDMFGDEGGDAVLHSLTAILPCGPLTGGSCL